MKRSADVGGDVDIDSTIDIKISDMKGEFLTKKNQLLPNIFFFIYR